MESTPIKTSLCQPVAKKTIASIINPNYVTVSCRLKPLLQNEERSKIDVNRNNHTITISEPSKSISKTYGFDQIFDESTQQDEFVDYICDPLIQFIKYGGDTGLIFSYGITNSGKTFSILGTTQQPGILLCLIKKLSQQFKDDPIRITACELYKDQFYSLKNKGEKLYPKQIRGTYSLEDCQFEIIDQQNMETLFSTYLQNRAMSQTAFNSHSSRSHAIFKIQTSRFKIGIVDLAGSQRYSRMQQKGDIKQTIFINSSLLTLKKCILALQQRSVLTQKIMVPYRQSKLTQSLMEYFVPTSKINIIVNINQAKQCSEQNLIVMDYTSKAKNIHSNVNSDFALMIKNSHKKYEELKSAVKSSKKQVNSIKPILKIGNQQVVITEQMLSDQQTSDLIEKSIINSERNKLLQKKIQSLFFNQICQESSKFMNYLEIDSKMRKQEEQKKLQDFRNMDIALTEKKLFQEDIKIRKKSFGVNTAVDGDQQKVLQSLKKNLTLSSGVKRKLIEMFQQERKKKLKDAETCFSTNRKYQFLQDNYEQEFTKEKTDLNIFNNNSDGQVDFSTPSKKKNNIEYPVLQQQEQSQPQLNEQQINFFERSFKKSIMMLGSGLKMVKNGFNAVSNLALRTNKKMTEKNLLNENQKLLIQKKQKLNLKPFQIEQHVSPFKKICVDMEINTDIIYDEIEVIPLSNTQNQKNIQINQVGVQVLMESSSPKTQINQEYIQVLEQAIKRQETHKKNGEYKLKKNKRGMKKKQKQPQMVEKTASAYKSSAKRFVAKNTRAARKNKQLILKKINEN